MTEIAPESTSSRKPLVVGGVALAAVVVLGGSAAFAWQQLSGGGTQPHDVLPSSVIAYARVDGDPSAAQKMKLLHLLKKSPDLAKEIGIKDDDQDLRATIIKEVLSDCEMHYNKDVAPWLGDRFGAGLASNGKTGFLAIQVKDEKAARKGLKLAGDCLGYEDMGLVFTKGYALLGEGQKATEAAAKQAEKSPLSDKPAFVEDMETLGDPGLVSVWADAKALNDSLGKKTGGSTDKSLIQTRSSAASLRAGDDNIEITGIAHQKKDIDKVKPVDLGKLPIDALLVASLSGGGRQVDENWTGLSQQFADGFAQGFSQDFSGDSPSVTQDEIDSTLEDIEKATGFDLPADLKTLLGDNITLDAGDRNLTKIDQLQGPGDVKDLDVAVALHSDSAKAFALANKIASKLSAVAGVDLAVVKTKDGAVLATNERFAKSFTKGKALRDSENFSSVIPDENSAYGGFYFDIAKALKVARAMDVPADDLAQVKALKALGLSVTNDGDRVIRGTLKLSFR